MEHAQGTFVIERRGEVYILRFTSTWDLEGARVFFDAYKKAVHGDGLSRFGVISDMRRFEGGSPEAVDYFGHISRWALAQGQVARAVLAYSAFEAFIVEQVVQERISLPSQTFELEDDALAWLEGLGLKVE